MKSKEKYNNGITLIALIITIVILLILAGITIAALTGENGLFTRAQQAKDSWEQGDLKEKIQMAVLNSKINDDNIGDIDKKILQSELEKIDLNIKKSENEDLPWEVSKGELTFKIDKDGNVEYINQKGIILDKTVVKLLQGKTENVSATIVGGVTGNVIWKSEDESVATVEDGKITAVGASGKTKIVVHIEGTEYKSEIEVIIVQKLTSLKYEQTTVEISLGASMIPQVQTVPSVGELEDIEYTSSASDIVTVDNSGKITGMAIGNATITAKGKLSGVSGTYNVNVKDLSIGDYVKYEVSYKDVYDNKEYTVENGWRVLDVGTKNEDGTYTGTKLVSTGIPVKLKFKGFNIDNKEWWGTTQQTGNSGGGYRAAYGLINNFEKITFNQGSTQIDNNGIYLKINGTESGDIKGSVFLNNNAKNVYNIKKGEGYNNVPDAGYNKTYWLSQANSGGGDDYLTYWGNNFDNNGAWNATHGLRPVILIKDNAKIVSSGKNKYWKID